MPGAVAAAVPIDNELFELAACVWRNARFEPGGLSVVIPFNDLSHLVQASDDRRAIVRHAQIDQFAHGAAILCHAS